VLLEVLFIMNQYLFLFPVKEYFEACLNACGTFEFRGHKPAELIHIIDARYRNKGYKINWLLFSREDDLSKPDLRQVPDFLEIEEHDGILVAGVSFGEHTSKGKYADSDYVLDQLPIHRRLVVGGFHQWDCVNRVAERSHERGIETFVDEDTTELFFGRQLFSGIPLIRKKWSLRELGIPEKFYKFAKKRREGKPWFVRA